MSSAEMTLIGLYNYDHTLFDLLEMPDGIDKGLLIDSILMNGGEYEVLYPNPVLLKDLIGSWSRQWSNVFTNWLKVTNDMNDVAPLENYDRFEDWTDNTKTKNTNSDSRHSNDEFSASNSSSSSDTGNTTNQTSAFDSNTFVNHDKSDITNSNTTSGTANNTTISNSNSSNEFNGTNDSTHSGHIHGNIGVTTAAQMFQSFYDVMKTYGNIYESISYIFLQNFVIPIL